MKPVELPSDPLLAAIPPQVRNEWRKKPTPELVRRLEFFCACGPKPSDDVEAMHLIHNRAVRAAWETYVHCAFACGLFEGERGKDLRGRLASRDADDFRSAMAECLACWFLAGKLSLPVHGNAPGRGTKVLDMRAVIGGQDVGVEVKAPYRELPSNGHAWCGHDANLLAQCLETANKQFSDDMPNILVLVPHLRTPVSVLRVQLVTALYGEEKITCRVDMSTGESAGPTTTEFFPEGKFLRRRQPSGTLIKPDGMPGYTRISAVIVIEEEMREQYRLPDLHLLADEETARQIWPMWERARDLWSSRDNADWVDHNVLVAHNPHARHPVSSALFGEYVQFMDLGAGYGWSDGASLHR